MSRRPRPEAADDAAPIWIVAGVIGLTVILWLVGHEKIAWAVMHVRLWEAKLLAFDEEARRKIFTWIAITHPRDATLKQLWQSGAVVGYYLRWLVLAVIVGVFAWMYTTHPGRQRRFNRKFDIRSLARYQLPLFPQLAPSLTWTSSTRRWIIRSTACAGCLGSTAKRRESSSATPMCRRSTPRPRLRHWTGGMCCCVPRRAITDCP